MAPIIPYFPVIQFQLDLPDFMPIEQLVFHGFGLCLGIGMVYGCSLTFSRAKKQGLDTSTFKWLFFWLVFSVIVGGHFGYGLFYEPERFFANPLLFLDMSSGLSSFGGFITFTLGAIWLLKKHQKPFLPYADNIMFGFSFGWLFGRLGCTLNHEHPGSPTDFWLGRYCRPVEGHTLDLPAWIIEQPVDFRFSHCIDTQSTAVTNIADQVTTDYSGILAVHDTGMYEMFYALILLMTYLFLDRKPRPHGTFLLIMLFTYIPLRFVMDFIRPLEGNVRYSLLTPAQWGCIGFFSVCMIALIVYRKNLIQWMVNSKGVK